MVASRCPQRLRPAAFESRVTSASVRYSRVRNSAFGLRCGTVCFSVLGAISLKRDFAMCCRLHGWMTVQMILHFRTVYHDRSRAVPRVGVGPKFARQDRG